jgi:hypothetical protein
MIAREIARETRMKKKLEQNTVEKSAGDRPNDRAHLRRSIVVSAMEVECTVVRVRRLVPYLGEVPQPPAEFAVACFIL